MLEYAKFVAFRLVASMLTVTIERAESHSLSISQKEQPHQERDGDDYTTSENAEPNEGCTNKPGNVRDAWSVIVT